MDKKIEEIKKRIKDKGGGDLVVEYLIALHERLEKVAACAQEVDFNEMYHIITACEVEYGSDHTKEENQLKNLQQAIKESK